MIKVCIDLEFQQLSVNGKFNLNPASSYFTKGEHRIYLRCAPRWKVAGQHCDHKQKERHSQKHKQIVRVHAV